MLIVTATILSEGKVIPPQYDLMRISINREVNRIPFASLVLQDGNPATQEFELSDKAFFELGKAVEIQLRYEGSDGNKTVFKGQVIRHNLEVNATDSLLTIELRDEAFGMTKTRQSVVFNEMSDTDIFKKLISSAGLKAGTLAATQPKHEEIVQYYCSDWDFMLSRAEANNLLVLVEDGAISAEVLKLSGTAKHTFSYGIDMIYGFELEADASHQYEKIESVSWDIKEQKLSKKSSAANFSLSQGNMKGKTIAGRFKGKNYQLTNAVPLDAKETKAWADATMARTRMAFIKGTLTLEGTSKIKVLDEVELENFGKRFNGKALITGINHTVDRDGWVTNIQLGLNAKSFARSPDILDTPAAGLLPAVHGLQIGIVEAFKEDEGKELRVRITLPGVDPEKGQIWARLVSPEAGLGKDNKGRGYFFRPEAGDEVVVGFFNDDPRQAVILGSLFSSKNVLPKGWEKLDKENAFKGIVSKTGITFEINDKEQTLKLLTSEKQSILMDEKNKTIEIIDLNENTITLNDTGISIKVADKLSIEAEGDIELKGKNIKIDASANVEIKGSKVDVK